MAEQYQKRLIDQILRHGVHVPPWIDPFDEAYRQHQIDTMAALKEAVPFVIDNVTEYLYAENDQEKWEYEKDFPCLSPPYESFWMETCRPSKVRSSVYGDQDDLKGKLPNRWGILFTATELDTAGMSEGEAREEMLDRARAQFAEEWPKVAESVLEKAKEYGQFNYIHHLDDAERGVMATYRSIMLAEKGEWSQLLPPDNARWIMKGDLIIEAAKRIHVGPVVSWTFVLDESGAPIQPPMFAASVSAKGMKPDLGAFGDANALSFSSLLAISFAHHKDTRITRTEPPGNANRAYRKKAKRDLAAVHTLDLSAVRELLQADGEVKSKGLKHAVSSCRAHFDVRLGI